MERSVKVGLLALSALTGIFVFTALSGVKVLSRVGPKELLSNPGFETPVLPSGGWALIRQADWQTFTSGTAELMALWAGPAHAGSQAVRFVSHGIPNFYQGLYQAVPVTPGETYQFSVYVKNDSTHPLKGSVIGQLSLEWHDANGAEAGRLWSPAWGAPLPTTDWTRFEVVGAAPPNAAKAHCVIVEKGQGQPVANGVFLVDDASVVKVSGE
jgi:Carbohydrate binding domain